MGLIRGGLLTLVSILLFLSLFATNTFLTMSMSLNHNVVKPELISVVNSILINQTNVADDINKNIGWMQLYCKNNSVFTKKISDPEFVFEIPCEVVENGSEAIINYAVNDIVETNYYKKYDCKFWQCEYNPPFYLFSEKAYNYWKGWFYWSLFASLVLIALAFILIEIRSSIPFLLGGILIISSLPFVKIEWLFSLLGSWKFLQFFSLFFSESYKVFLISFISGVLLIGIGIVLKFLGIGDLISKLFRIKKSTKIDKKELKEEIKKEIKGESKEKKAKK